MAINRGLDLGGVMAKLQNARNAIGVSLDPLMPVEWGRPVQRYTTYTGKDLRRARRRANRNNDAFMSVTAKGRVCFHNQFVDDFMNIGKRYLNFRRKNGRKPSRNRRAGFGPGVDVTKQLEAR